MLQFQILILHFDVLICHYHLLIFLYNHLIIFADFRTLLIYLTSLLFDHIIFGFLLCDLYFFFFNFNIFSSNCFLLFDTSPVALVFVGEGVGVIISLLSVDLSSSLSLTGFDI